MGPNQRLTQWVPGFFPGRQLDETSTSFVHRLRMSGTRTLFPLDALMAGTQTLPC